MIVLIVVVIVLLVTNLWLLSRYLNYRYRVKQKGLFGRWPVRQVSLDEVDAVFVPNELGPTLETEVKFIGRSSLNVPGGTSDAEAWILAVLARKAKNIFEFGTCTGKTTYLMAANMPSDAHVTTLTLPPDQVDQYDRGNEDNEKATNDAISESAFTNFLYSGTPQAAGITQLFCDSKHFDETPYKNKMDLIFIDGSHAYSYILSDSNKALEMIRPGGIILWHDYRGPRDTKDVFRALNELSAKYPFVHIRDTSFVAYRKPI